VGNEFPTAAHLGRRRPRAINIGQAEAAYIKELLAKIGDLETIKERLEEINTAAEYAPHRSYPTSETSVTSMTTSETPSPPQETCRTRWTISATGMNTLLIGSGSLLPERKRLRRTPRRSRRTPQRSNRGQGPGRKRKGGCRHLAKDTRMARSVSTTKENIFSTARNIGDADVVLAIEAVSTG
jgi:hypothetical protein